MNKLKYLFILLLIGCSPTKVLYDYDSQHNFTTYKTFDFFEDAGKGLNQLDVKRIKSSITKLLSAKGMSISDNPDMYINFFSSKEQKQNNSSIGIGVGGGSGIGLDIFGGIPINDTKTIQSLTIDFVESAHNQLIWQSVIDSELRENMTPEQKESYYLKNLTKSFTQYPPKK